MNWDTKGAAESPVDQPWTIDPLTSNGKALGTYRVLAVDLRAYQYLNGTTTQGNWVPSIKTDGTGQKHFVVPKKAGGSLPIVALLTGQMEPGIGFDSLYEFVPIGDNGVISSNICQVKTDTTGKYTVQVRTKDSSQTVIASINVWVVWCASTATLTRFVPATITYPGFTSIAEEADWSYKATIQPDSICDASSDVPSLTGASQTHVPHYKDAHAFDGRPLGDAKSKWNLTRQWRERDLCPTVNGNDAGFPTTGRLFSTIPNPNVLQNTSLDQGNDGYPQTEVEGNDDGGANDNPYSTVSKATLTDTDPPSAGILNTAGAVNDSAEFRAQFREFVRLEIAGKWYKVSDYATTRYHAIFKKVDESVISRDVNGNGNQTDKLWSDNSSVADNTNGGF